MSFITSSVVESGEGIESVKIQARHRIALMHVWNPEKELKDHRYAARGYLNNLVESGEGIER